MSSINRLILKDVRDFVQTLAGWTGIHICIQLQIGEGLRL